MLIPHTTTLAARSDRELIETTSPLVEELHARVEENKLVSPFRLRLYGKALSALLECRAYLRELETTPAAPVPATERGASEGSGAPTGDTTTAGAAGVSPLRKLRELANRKEQCPRCRDEGLDHDGVCRPIAGPETTPALAEPSELQSRGPRGPEAAEGAREAGRAKPAPVNLAEHLAVLKGGAA